MTIIVLHNSPVGNCFFPTDHASSVQTPWMAIQSAMPMAVGSAAANSVQATYFIPFNAFIVAIGLYWAISILLELLIKRLTAWGAKRGMSHA